MTKEEAIYKAKHLRKVHPSICVDSEDFWETVIAALEQETKAGHWIEHEDEDSSWYECDCYHREIAYNTYFCPNCGAKMEVKE